MGADLEARNCAALIRLDRGSADAVSHNTRVNAGGQIIAIIV